MTDGSGPLGGQRPPVPPSSSDSLSDVLDAAVLAAKSSGYAVTGWTLQSGEGGYAAWLYHDDGNTQQPLTPKVDLHTSAGDAALACLDHFSPHGG